MVNVDVMLRCEQEYTDEKTGETFTLPYRVYYPSSYNESDSAKYPLLFFLHGHGECGTDNELHIRVLNKANRLINMVMEQDNCIIIAPQCPCNVKYEWVPVNHKWDTGSRELTPEPTMGLAAAVPVCGSGIPSMADKLVDIGIWAFHGEEDGTVPAQGTRDMEKAIKEAGGTKMKATYFPGVGHDSWIPAYETEGLIEWLFAQSK